jgi:hypothetical protein
MSEAAQRRFCDYTSKYQFAVIDRFRNRDELRS